MVTFAHERSSQPPGDTPRERRKQATRRAIQVAAVRLVLERGPDHVTVQAISDAADIAPRTFFTYFSSKEQALMMDVPWSGERLAALLLARPPGEPPLRALRAVFKQCGAQMAERWEETALWRKLAVRYPDLVRGYPVGEGAVVRALAAALSTRMGVDHACDPYPAVAVAAAVAAGRAALQRWSEQDPTTTDPVPLDHFLDEALDLLERGL